MNAHHTTSRIILSILTLTATSLLSAASSPLFTLMPISSTSFTVLSSASAVVQYRVTNQTEITRTLTMKPIQGIQQLLAGASCQNPFTLAPHQSCMLNLLVDGAKIPAQITGGPEICKTTSASNHSPDPFLCAQPSQADSLDITQQITNDNTGALSVSPTTLTLTTSLTLDSSNTGVVTLTSNAQRSITGLTFQTEGTALEGNIHIHAGSCNSILPPGASCSATLVAGSTAVSSTNLAVTGNIGLRSFNFTASPIAETVSTYITVTIDSSTAAPLAITPDSPLILQGGGSSGILTIRNTSTTLTGTNVHANLPSALTDAGVTQDASDCTTLLPASSCNLIFTPGNQAVRAHFVPIAGDDQSTYVVGSLIAVNAPPQVPIAFTSTSPQTLLFSNGNNLLTFDIQNQSTTGTVVDVQPYFTGTALNGLIKTVTSTCSGTSSSSWLLPGESCTFTLETISNTTVLPEASFVIQGKGQESDKPSTTLAVRGIEGFQQPTNIALNQTHTFAYVVNHASNSVTQCAINQTTGNFYNCFSFAIIGFNAPTGIAINSTSTYAYIVNTANQITQCSIDSTAGNFLSCETNRAPTFDFVAGSIVLNSTDTFTYLGSSTGGDFSVASCPISETTGSITTCHSEVGNGGIIGPVALHPNANWVYIAGGAEKCSINPTTGVIGACSSTSAPYTASGAIAINPAGTIAYLVNLTNYTVIQCAINAQTANFSNCINSGADHLDLPSGIAIDSSNTFVYITNKNNNTVTQCTVDGMNGSLSNCVAQPAA